jgi:hypothetical protein
VTWPCRRAWPPSCGAGQACAAGAASGAVLAAESRLLSAYALVLARAIPEDSRGVPFPGGCRDTRPGQHGSRWQCENTPVTPGARGAP